MNTVVYDAGVILGGGRYSENNLTPLSKMRLDHGLELYKKGLIRKMILPGGKHTTASPKAIEFNKTTAQVRREYLLNKGSTDADIILAEDGRDTIYEAFAVRAKVRELGYKRLLLITSERHMERALYVFQRILDTGITIDNGSGLGEVQTGDILLVEEESEYLSATRQVFSSLPDNIPDPKNWEDWYEGHQSLYKEFTRIHDLYHPPGKESQAYAGVSSS